MRSWKIATFAGIGVYVHWSFLILPVLVAYSSFSAGRGTAKIVESVLLVLAIFGCVLLHEFGHALTARRFGIKTRSITLLPIGGVANLDRMPERPLQELAVAVAGPLVNVVIACVLAMVLLAAGVFGQTLTARMVQSSFLLQLLAANVILVLFNMLPAFPMDGGRVLRAILATRLSYVRATSIAAFVGRGMAILFAVLGFFYDFVLVFIALFIYVAGRAEESMARTKASLQGWLVADAMERRFQMVPADANLAEVAQAVGFSTQRSFPVIDGEQFVGMLERSDMAESLTELSKLRVRDVMRQGVTMLEHDTPLAESLHRFHEGEVSSLPVGRHGHLVGLLTNENLRQWLSVWAKRSTAMPQQTA